MADQVVTITVKGNAISVDKEPVDVSTDPKDNQQVVWVGPDDFDFDIVLPEKTPFVNGGHVFRGEKENTGRKFRAQSGLARSDSGGSNTYKYKIYPKDARSVRVLDPTIRPTP